MEHKTKIIFQCILLYVFYPFATSPVCRCASLECMWWTCYSVALPLLISSRLCLLYIYCFSYNALRWLCQPWIDHCRITVSLVFFVLCTFLWYLSALGIIWVNWFFKVVENVVNIKHHNSNWQNKAIYTKQHQNQQIDLKFDKLYYC